MPKKTTRMGYPLPEVIEPGEYKCLRIWYPNDQAYRRAVLGAVSYIQNWFAWERDTDHTGTLAAAEFRKAYTLTVNDILAGKDCGSVTDEDSDTTTEQIAELARSCGLIVFESEDEMGQVVTEVFIDDDTGELVVRYGHCCEDRYELAGTVSDQPYQPSSEDVAPPDPAPENIACQKAYWMASQVVDFMSQSHSEFPSMIWEYPSAMRSGSFGRLNISDWSYVKLHQVFNAIYQVSSVFIELWSPINTQQLTCLWAKFLNNDDYSLSREEFDSMKSSIQNVGNDLMEIVLQTVFDAFNYSNFALLAAEARDVSEYDCDCPMTVPEYAGALSFSGSYDAPQHPEWVNSVVIGDNGRYVDISWTTPPGFSKNEDSFKLFMHVVGSVSSFALRVVPLNGNVPLNSQTTSEYCGNPDYWTQPGIIWTPVSSDVWATVGNMRYNTTVFTNPATEDVTLDSYFCDCPSNETGDYKTYNFRFELIEVNGESLI